MTFDRLTLKSSPFVFVSKLHQIRQALCNISLCLQSFWALARTDTRTDKPKTYCLRTVLTVAEVQIHVNNMYIMQCVLHSTLQCGVPAARSTLSLTLLPLDTATNDSRQHCSSLFLESSHVSSRFLTCILGQVSTFTCLRLNISTVHNLSPPSCNISIHFHISYPE